MFIYFCFAVVKSCLSVDWALWSRLNCLSCLDEGSSLYFLLIALKCLEWLPFTYDDAVCFEYCRSLTSKYVVSLKYNPLFFCFCFFMVVQMAERWIFTATQIQPWWHLRALLATHEKSSGWHCVTINLHSSLNKCCHHWASFYFFTCNFTAEVVSALKAYRHV